VWIFAGKYLTAGKTAKEICKMTDIKDTYGNTVGRISGNEIKDLYGNTISRIMGNEIKGNLWKLYTKR
jgi:hypothetical protein